MIITIPSFSLAGLISLPLSGRYKVNNEITITHAAISKIIGMEHKAVTINHIDEDLLQESHEKQYKE